MNIPMKGPISGITEPLSSCIRNRRIQLIVCQNRRQGKEGCSSIAEWMDLQSCCISRWPWIRFLVSFSFGTLMSRRSAAALKTSRLFTFHHRGGRWCVEPILFTVLLEKIPRSCSSASRRWCDRVPRRTRPLSPHLSPRAVCYSSSIR